MALRLGHEFGDDISFEVVGVTGRDLSPALHRVQLPPSAAASYPGFVEWITRERPKIDRIACPWLVERFIDKAPEFLFVPSQDVLRVAEKTGAALPLELR